MAVSPAKVASCLATASAARSITIRARWRRAGLRRTRAPRHRSGAAGLPAGRCRAGEGACTSVDPSRDARPRASRGPCAASPSARASVSSLARPCGTSRGVPAGSGRRRELLGRGCSMSSSRRRAPPRAARVRAGGGTPGRSRRSASMREGSASSRPRAPGSPGFDERSPV